MAHNEAVDAVSKQPLAAGLHLVVTAILCAKGATADERELVKRILLHNPQRPDAPRESESIAGAFNRQMDAAIKSCNDSAHDVTRALRRAKLAADLDRAGLVLMDRAQLAELLERDVGAPIPMVLHCPRCSLQHIDAAAEGWDNPPHRSHLCDACGLIWRPADVATVGVAAIETRGKADTFPDEDDGSEDDAEFVAELLEHYPELEPDPATIDGPYGGWNADSGEPSSSGAILGLEFQEGVSFLTHSPSFDVDVLAASSSAYASSNVND